MMRSTIQTLGRLPKTNSTFSWKLADEWQQTLANSIEISGTTLHSGKVSKVKLCPELGCTGRYFQFRSNLIPASIDFAENSPLCTTLCKDGVRVRTVEHLLSALEAMSVDNCRIEIDSEDSMDDLEIEVPIVDGSAKVWVKAIKHVGLKLSRDKYGITCGKIAPYIKEPIHIGRNDSFIAAFPSPKLHITYGIDFPQVAAIGCQWYSSGPFDDNLYAEQIAPSRTFCINEEVEHMLNAGLIKGGSMENALVFSANEGCLNPPLRFHDEPCRHKVLDLIGDLSLFAQKGSQGLPVAHIIAYKGGHALHADFVRRLMEVGEL